MKVHVVQFWGQSGYNQMFSVEGTIFGCILVVVHLRAASDPHSGSIGLVQNSASGRDDSSESLNYLVPLTTCVPASPVRLLHLRLLPRPTLHMTGSFVLVVFGHAGLANNFIPLTRGNFSAFRRFLANPHSQSFFRGPQSLSDVLLVRFTFR